MSATKAFQAALKAFIDKDGYGSQSQLAEKAKVDRHQLNRLVHGRANASAATMDRIAEHFGLTLGEFLRIGESLLRGEPFFPYMDKVRDLPKEKQAEEIIKLVNEDIGLQGCLRHYRPDGWSRFVSGKITAVEFYQMYLKELEVLIETIKGL